MSGNCVKIWHWFHLGIEGLRNLGIEGILSFLIYLGAENLVLWARSETVGYAICPSSLWFQVSGVRCQ